MRVVALGALALLLGGCPNTQASVWCGPLAVHEDFFIPTGGFVSQDFPQEQRCVTLISCGGTTSALVLDSEGRCTVLVDFPTPDEGTVQPGGHCETSTSRIGGQSRDFGIAVGGKVTLRDGQLEADIDWDVEIRPSEIARIGAKQHYALRSAVQSTERSKQDPAAACTKPEPLAGPEDFSALVGCAPEDFADRTDASAERVVRFGNELGARYSPRCMSIAVGQAVAFEGPFSTYSMAPGLVESLSAGAPYNPIGYVFFNDRAEYTFDRPGDYLYSNNAHAAQGMTGLIRVR